MSLGMALRGHVGAALTASALMGCQTAPPVSETARDEGPSVLEQGMLSQPEEGVPPQEVTDLLLPPIDIDAGPGEAVDVSQRFDVSVIESPARAFFMSLMEGTPYNVLVHPGVEGTISLSLKNVTIPDVMEMVRSVYGYEFRRTRYGYEVLPARLRSRVYQVNFPHMRRFGASETRVSSGQITQTPQELSGTGESTTISGYAGKRTASGTQINTEQPATTFWTELTESVSAILAGAEGRSVVVNPQAGVVVVRAMPHELREVEAYLHQIQAIAARQVVLEAKILEVELLDEYRQGINWAALLNIDGTEFVAGQTGGGSIFDSLFQPGLTPFRTGLQGNRGSLNPNTPVAVDGNAVSAFGGVFTLAIAATDFNAFIELIGNQGNVNVLSSPRVSTLNNQKAVIKVGSDEFFVTDVSSTTVASGGATTTSPDIELTPFFSGIALDVTPQISEKGDVILHVHPSVSVVTDQRKTVTIGDDVQTLPLAFSTVRESDSIVRAQSGQVVVIGGLMRNDLADLGSGIPGLMDLPFVGNLFRHQEHAIQKTELVILLRPIVVAGSQPWKDLMEGSARRIRRMNQRAEELYEIRVPDTGGPPEP